MFTERCQRWIGFKIMRTAKQKSKKLIRRLSVALQYSQKAESQLFCWRLEKFDGFKYSDDQRKKLYDAQASLANAELVVKEVFAEMIGKAIVSEVSAGEWK